MAIGALIGAALAGVTGGVGQQIANNTVRQTAIQDKTLSDFIGSIVSGQGDPAVLKAPEMQKVGKRLYGDAWPLVGQAATYNWDTRQRAMQEFMGSSGGGAQPMPAPMPIAQGGSVPGSIGEVPRGAVDITQPSMTRTSTMDPATGKVTFSRTATSPGGIAISAERRAQAGEQRASAEEQRKQKMSDVEYEGLLQKQTEHLEQNTALASIKAMILEASETSDPAKKQALYNRMLAAAVGANIKDPDLTILLKAGLEETKKKGPTVDLGNPHERDFVADTGKNPKTMEPVDEPTMRAATRARDEALKRQQTAQRDMMDLRTANNDTKQARVGAIHGLQKDSDDIAAFTQRVDQVKGALTSIKNHLSVYSTTVAGSLVGAQLSKIMQTTRGQDIRTIEQALNILQSQEARFMAGEKGRIPYQLETQWRAVLADPTKMTRATTEKLLSSTIQRLDDMTKAKDEAVKVRARQARGLGVSPAIVDMFERGEREALGRLLPEAAAAGSISPEMALPQGAKMEGGQIISESGKYIWDGSAWKPR